METRENYPPGPDAAKLQDEAALSPPFQIWLSGRPTLLGVASIISSWCWEGREPECSTCATIAPPFHNEAALSPHFQIWLSGRPTLLGVASIISS